MAKLGWDATQRLDIECHIGDKVYHRGVSPRAVAASHRNQLLAYEIDQVTMGVAGDVVGVTMGRGIAQ